MLVVIAYCRKDQDQAERLSAWMAELGPYPNHWLLVARDVRAKENVFANAGFASVEEIVVPDDGRNEWPFSCNRMFCNAAKRIEFTSKYPFLWLEPDAVPMRAGWLDAIAAEYAGCGKPFLGDRVEVENVPLHMSGIGIYPGVMSNHAGLAYLAHDLAWDVFAAEQIVPKAHFTNLIEHSWKRDPVTKQYAHVTFESWEQVEREIAPETVLYHACKNDSLIRILREHRNLPVPVLADTASMGQTPSCESEVVSDARESTNVSVVIPEEGDSETSRSSHSRGGQFISAPDHNPTSREAGATGAGTFTCDIFIKTYPPDYPWLRYCLRSIDKFAKDFRATHVVNPEGFPSDLAEWSDLFPLLRLHTPAEYGPDGYLSQQVFKLHADTFSDADYIIHVDSDTIFTRPVTPQTYFTDGKIDWMITPYAMTETPWQPITEKFLGRPVEFEFMRRAPQVLPRWIYAAIRDFCVQKHGRMLEQYIMEQPHRAFSEYNAVGAFAYYFHRNKFNWINTAEVPESEWPVLTVLQKQSWGGLTPEIEAEFEAILGKEGDALRTNATASSAESTEPTSDSVPPLSSAAPTFEPDGAAKIERIVAAAILQDGVIYTGTRHGFIICDIVLMTGTRPVTGQQGFMTSKGDFVSREIAGEIALRAGQVRSLKYSHTQLFSEDVWDAPFGPVDSAATSTHSPTASIIGELPPNVPWESKEQSLEEIRNLASRLKTFCGQAAQVRAVREILHRAGVISLPYRMKKRKGWKKRRNA